MHFSILNNNATHRWMWPVKHMYVRASRQTQAGIGHSAPAHRGGHVQNRSRRREQRRGRQKTNPQAEQPRVDGRPSRKAKAHQRRLRRRQPRARRRRHTKQERSDKSQTLQLHAPRGWDDPVQQQGRGGTGRDKPWQPQQGYEQKEMVQATPPLVCISTLATAEMHQHLHS